MNNLVKITKLDALYNLFNDDNYIFYNIVMFCNKYKEILTREINNHKLFTDDNKIYS